MKPDLTLLALVATSLALPGAAAAEATSGLHQIVVTGDVPVAIPLNQHLRDRFGMGAMPSISAAVPVGNWTLLGLRLRGGFLSNGPAPKDPSIKDPGTGGLGALMALARFRPLPQEGSNAGSNAGSDAGSHARGPWIEVGVGAGLTGSLVRATGEAGLGWNFRAGGITFGPTLRYLHVMQPASALDSSDAQIGLAGLEVVLHDTHESAPPPTPPMPAETPKMSDRDGDGIPDALDKCPDDPEDKDGFEDDDGCPDPDNDKDGIPDVSDACPNEPETVNGFQDEDGCPDSAEIVVKEDRILLTEHVLFDTNRARVNAEGRPALAAVFNLWKQHPEWDHLVVDGYADRRGPDEFNVWLSRQRAERVIKMLVEMGFPVEKLRVRAFGKQQLHVEGDSEEADRQNRRVEFVIVKKGEASTNEEAATQPSADRQPPATPSPTEPPPATSTKSGIEP
jgi:outer membrane protein OmpA-like peptidoglycan-associated protein